MWIWQWRAKPVRPTRLREKFTTLSICVAVHTLSFSSHSGVSPLSLSQSWEDERCASETCSCGIYSHKLMFVICDLLHSNGESGELVCCSSLLLYLCLVLWPFPVPLPYSPLVFLTYAILSSERSEGKGQPSSTSSKIASSISATLYFCLSVDLNRMFVDACGHVF